MTDGNENPQSASQCVGFCWTDTKGTGFSQSCSRLCLSEESEDESHDSRRSKVSVIDLSVLFEGSSGSDSSLEFDTSYSQEVPEPASVPTAIPHIPAGCYDCHRDHDEDYHMPWPVTLLCRRSVWKTVVVGQVMSMCLAVQDVTIDGMVNSGHMLPANAQNLPHYILLALVWTSQLAMREEGRSIGKVLRLSGLRYVLLVLLHVEIDNMIVSSLKHDSFIGNQMIDCVAASLAFIIAYVCLDVEFEATHVAGFAVAFTGAVGMCAAIMKQSSEDEDIRWGDVLRFGSGLFITFNSLAQELIVKAIDTVEYLGMVGLLGTVFCLVQMATLERGIVVPRDYVFWLTQMVFSLVQLIFYCLAPTILRDVGATGLHLALMSSSFYSAILYNILDNKETLIFCSWILVIVGSYTFTIKRTTIQKHYFFPVNVTIARHNSG